MKIVENLPESYKSTLTAFGHRRELSETPKSSDEKLKEFQLSSPETVNDRNNFKIQIVNNYLNNDLHSKYCSEDIIKVSQHLQTPKEITNTKEKGGTNILHKPCLTIDTARKRIYVTSFGSNFSTNSSTEKSTSIPPL